MGTLLEDRAFVDQISRVEMLLAELETIEDPHTRTLTNEIVAGLVAFYGEGLCRILAIVRGLEPATAARIDDQLTHDDLISHLLLLHDLHPLDAETRVTRALDGVRPYLESHGGNVELLGIEGGTVHLRLVGSCHGCPSSTATLKLAIEEAIRAACPDIEEIDAEGAVADASSGSFIPLTVLGASLPSAPAPNERKGWSDVDGVIDMNPGSLLARHVSGNNLLFLNLDGDFYSYDNRCPGCGGMFFEASSAAPTLTCECGLHFDVRKAGRCLDSPDLHLNPIPLLAQNGVIKVALDGALPSTQP
jgi:Fe-S cluster biogenesis protein NfuA/nitrite reductase/ring-hydroxylating ferredoxin subunit